MLESYHYPQFDASTYIALYSTIRNATQLRSRIIKAATAVGDEGDREREAVNFAFVDAKMVCNSALLIVHCRTDIVAHFLDY